MYDLYLFFNLPIDQRAPIDQHTNPIIRNDLTISANQVLHIRKENVNGNSSLAAWLSCRHSLDHIFVILFPRCSKTTHVVSL